jgi:hypothetical protein
MAIRLKPLHVELKERELPMDVTPATLSMHNLRRGVVAAGQAGVGTESGMGVGRWSSVAVEVM